MFKNNYQLNKVLFKYFPKNSLHLLLFISFFTLTHCSFAQENSEQKFWNRFYISPTISYIFSSAESGNELIGTNGLFKGIASGLNFNYQINQTFGFRLSTNYLKGQEQVANKVSFPIYEVRAWGRGVFISPSVVFLSNKSFFNVTPFLTFGALTGFPEVVYTYQNEKAIFTGNTFIGINSALGGKIKLNKSLSFNIEVQAQKANYTPSRVVYQSNDSVIIDESEDELNTSFKLDNFNLSLSLSYKFKNSK
ncbi:MAG: hypothetical protein CMO01_29555 [Thalassobius sp.]|nr:hypothetical protein [Thalassovita sp.]